MRHVFPCVCALACSTTTELVPVGTHPPHLQEFIAVEYPPPPAQIEEITPRHPKRPECAWVDGYPAWVGRRWVFQPGQWVRAAEGCYYAPAVVAWSKAGEPRLYYSAPRWYREDALSMSGPAAFCPSPPACEPSGAVLVPSP
jgi:hypothetical protein